MLEVEENSWLDELPAHWEVVPAWSLYRRVKRTGHPSEELLSVYRDYGVIPKSSRDDNHNVESEDLSGYQLVKEGDLVMNKMKAWQGSVALSEHRGIVSPAYFVFEPLHSGHLKYFHYLLRSPQYIAAYNRISKGVRVGQWDLDPAYFRTLQIPVPPFEEQKVIADFLDRELEQLDDLTHKLNQFTTVLEERLQVTLRDSTRAEDHSRIPEGWKVSKLGSLFKTIGSGTTPTAGDESNFGGEVPWVTTGELRENLILETERSITQHALRNFSALTVYPAGSLVMALYGATIGRLAFLGIPATVNQACCVMAAPKNVEPRFIYYALQASRDRLMAAAVGAGQPNISQEIVRQFRLNIPPLEQQKEIVSHLDRAVASTTGLVTKAQQMLETLKQRRTALISDAVTGKTDVQGKN
jgi:type I restriction enzyme S subunit